MTDCFLRTPCQLAAQTRPLCLVQSHLESSRHTCRIPSCQKHDITYIIYQFSHSYIVIVVIVIVSRHIFIFNDQDICSSGIKSMIIIDSQKLLSYNSFYILFSTIQPLLFAGGAARKICYWPPKNCFWATVPGTKPSVMHRRIVVEVILLRINQMWNESAFLVTSH